MMKNYNLLKNKIIFGKYKLNKLIGKGSFGYVFKGLNTQDNSEVAIKVERKDVKTHLLEIESNFLLILKGYGIPELKSYGYSGQFYILVEELLGNNLGEIRKGKTLTIKDISMLAIQILDRMEYIHSKNIIHRDIKPENFLLGYNNSPIVYIIDFGISREYRSSRTGKHIKFSLTGKLFGTVRYVSFNASRGVQQSRRDDLESIGYMLLYIMKGKLPWQGINMRDHDRKKKYLQMLYLKKNITPEMLCKGLPQEFTEYVKYCKNLAFEQDPDYEYLRNLFRNILKKIH
jgi:serine/threonine protein kinase